MRENLPAPSQRRSSPATQNGWRNDPFTQLRQEMDRLFDDFISPSFAASGMREMWSFQPSLDMTDADKEVRIRADLPGVEEKDVELSLHGALLTIKGERREERDEEHENRRVSERAYGAFERSVRLPFEPDQAKVKADYHNGVLTITIPKPPEVTKATKRIPIATH